MNIKLPQEQQKWLEAEVAGLASIEAALAATVADLMAAEDGDFAWAKPYVDEARAAIAQGEQVTLDEFRSEIRETMANSPHHNSRRHLGEGTRRLPGDNRVSNPLRPVDRETLCAD